MRAVEEAEREVASAPFYRPLPRLLAPPGADGAPSPPPPLLLRQLVVYGLGSLEQAGGVHIRYQLALARLLAAALRQGVEREAAPDPAQQQQQQEEQQEQEERQPPPPLLLPPVAYDPVFTPLDRAVLARCGIAVAARDEGGRRVAAHPTLFFMPHCEAPLTDALLAANVAAGTLARVAILGNSFAGYVERWGGGGGGDGGGLARPDTLLALCACGAVVETRVPEAGFPVASAFNDTSMHRFAPDWRARLGAWRAGGGGGGGEGNC